MPKPCNITPSTAQYFFSSCPLSLSTRPHASLFHPRLRSYEIQPKKSSLPKRSSHSSSVLHSNPICYVYTYPYTQTLYECFQITITTITTTAVLSVFLRPKRLLSRGKLNMHTENRYLTLTHTGKEKQIEREREKKKRKRKRSTNGSRRIRHHGPIVRALERRRARHCDAPGKRTREQGMLARSHLYTCTHSHIYISTQHTIYHIFYPHSSPSNPPPPPHISVLFSI